MLIRLGNPGYCGRIRVAVALKMDRKYEIYIVLFFLFRFFVFVTIIFLHVPLVNDAWSMWRRGSHSVTSFALIEGVTFPSLESKNAFRRNSKFWSFFQPYAWNTFSLMYTLEKRNIFNFLSTILMTSFANLGLSTFLFKLKIIKVFASPPYSMEMCRMTIDGPLSKVLYYCTNGMTSNSVLK